MNSSLIDQLLKFYEEDPNDPFTIYGLALEYSKSSYEKAKEYFDKLLIEHPSYVPTYYHAGKLYEKLSEPNKAIEIYNTGMNVSKNAGNRHAFSELQGALNALLDEDEE